MSRPHVLALVVLFASTLVTAQDAAITGAWTLNPEQGTRLPERAEADPPRSPRGGQAGTGPGGMGGGLGRGGFGMPGMGGGNGPSEEDRRRLQVIRRRLTDIPDRLTIVRSEDAVIVTDDQGRSVSYKTDNKKQDRVTGDGEFTSKARMDGAALVIEEDFGGGVKLLTRYAPLSGESRQLEVTLKADGLPRPSRMGGGRGSNGEGPRDNVRRVYDASVD